MVLINTVTEEKIFHHFLVFPHKRWRCFIASLKCTELALTWHVLLLALLGSWTIMHDTFVVGCNNTINYLGSHYYCSTKVAGWHHKSESILFRGIISFRYRCFNSISFGAGVWKYIQFVENEYRTSRHFEIDRFIQYESYPTHGIAHTLHNPH